MQVLQYLEFVKLRNLSHFESRALHVKPHVARTAGGRRRRRHGRGLHVGEPRVLLVQLLAAPEELAVPIEEVREAAVLHRQLADDL